MFRSVGFFCVLSRHQEQYNTKTASGSHMGCTRCTYDSICASKENVELSLINC